MKETIVLGENITSDRVEPDLDEQTCYRFPRRLYRWSAEEYNYAKQCRELGIAPKTVAKNLGIPVTTIYEWKKKPPRWITDVFHPAIIDSAALSYVLGVLLGDGYIGGDTWYLKKSYPISLTVKDRDFAISFANALSSILHKRVAVRSVTKKCRGKDWHGYRVHTKHRAFSLWYHALNLSLIGACVRSELGPFLRGFADSEGNVRENRAVIRIYNKDESKLALVARLLSLLNISNKTAHVTPVPHGGVSYVGIYGKENLRRFHDLIGFSISRKQERVQRNMA